MQAPSPGRSRFLPSARLLLLATLLAAASLADGPDNWLRHEAERSLSFAYPRTLTLAESQGSFVLRHAVRARHEDPCAFKDDVAWLDELVDFDVTLELLESDLRTAVAGDSPGIAERFVTAEAVVPSPGYIDPWRIGTFSGFRIWRQVEGCGETRYYLRLAPRRTLRVTRRTVYELEYGSRDVRVRKALTSQKGVILPKQADVIFERVVASVRLNP